MSALGNSSEAYPSEIRPVLESIDREVDRQTDLHAKHSSAVSTRAALLVSTAVIFVSLPKADSAVGACTYNLALAFASVGAVCGVLALLRYSKGEEVSLRHLEKELWNVSQVDAVRALTAEKIATLEQDRERLEARHRITAVGFIFLSLSLLAIVLHLVFGF